MESKLNFSAIETYAKKYSARLGDSLFSSESVIDGDRILKFPVKQVGLFVLSDIYSSWSSEAEKLRSPYFDYESAAVKGGLQKLMNVLSNNISINRENLEPLLNNAVHKTLLLILSPYSYFKDLLLDKNIEADTFKELVKFIVINKTVAKTIVAKMELAEPGQLDRRILLDDVFLEVEGPEDSSNYFDIISEIHPIKVEDFYLTMNAPIDGEGDDEEEEGNHIGENTLNDQFANFSAHQTLADQLKQNQNATGSLKSMLSINQKFMFINDLFNDNQEDFNKVMDFLESCETKEVAISFINNNYLKHNIWNANAPQVKQFIALIDKKFE